MTTTEQIHDDHGHERGEGCGHVAFQHADHVDYAHDGHVHRQQEGQWSECEVTDIPLAVKIGARWAIGIGFALAASFAALAFVSSTWTCGAFVGSLIGERDRARARPRRPRPRPSHPRRLGRCVGGSLAVAAAGTVYSAVANQHLANGAAPADTLAAGPSGASVLLTILRPRQPRRLS